MTQLKPVLFAFRLHKEKQFNRKVVLNAQLRELKNEIDALTA